MRITERRLRRVIRRVLVESSSDSVVKKIDVMRNKVLSKLLKSIVSKGSIQKYILLSLGRGDLKFSFEKRLNESFVYSSVSKVLLEEKSDVSDKELVNYYEDLKKIARVVVNKNRNTIIGLRFINAVLLGKLGKDRGYSGKSVEILGDILENCSNEEFERLVKVLSRTLASDDKKKLHSILKDKLNLKDKLSKKFKAKNLGKDSRKLVLKSLGEKESESLKLNKGQYYITDKGQYYITDKDEYYITDDFALFRIKQLLGDYNRFLKDDKTMNLGIVKQIESILFGKKIEIESYFNEEFKNIESDFTKELSKVIDDFIDKNNLHNMKGEVFKMILSSNTELNQYKNFKSRYVKNKIKNLKSGKDLSWAVGNKNTYDYLFTFDKEMKDKLNRFRQERIEKREEREEKLKNNEKDILDKINREYRSGKKVRGSQAGKTMKRYY